MKDKRQEQQLETDSPDHPGGLNAQLSEPEASLPEQKAGSPPRRVRLPSWMLGLLVLALTAVLVWAGNAFIRSRQQLPEQATRPAPSATSAPRATRAPTSTPAPTPRPPSTPTDPVPSDTSETLVLVADLYPHDDGPYPNADLTELIYEALVAEVQERSPFEPHQVRIERLDRQVQDADTTRSAGETHSADYVLWGMDTKDGAESFLQRVGAQTRTRATKRGHDLTLSEPEQHALCVFTEAPGSIDAAVHYILGMAAYDQGEHDTAKAYWNTAIETARETEECTLETSVHLYQGNVHAFDGDYDAALAAFDAALELSPDFVPAHINRGSVHYALGDYETALGDLNHALELDPDTANTYYHRANVNRVLDQQDAALADLDRALELDPQHVRAYASRGLIHHNAGDHEAALDDYTRALALAPEAADIYLNRGGTYATLGQFDAALDDYTRALELSPADADAYYNRGTVYAMLEAYDQALADLDRALALNPDFTQVYGNRGLVYKAMGDTQKAIADLERFLELSDNPQWRQMIEQQLAELRGE